VAEICERAGVSKGALYHHFPTKQALFLALLDHWLGGVDAQLAAYRAGARNIPASIAEMAGVVSDVFRTGSSQLPLILEFWAQASHDPVVREATVAHYRRYRKLFAEIIEAGVAEGSLRTTDADLAARVMVSFAVGLLLQGLLDPQGADWGETARAGVQLILCELKR